jgi:DNA-binding NarL/FixJ family response regulator
MEGQTRRGARQPNRDAAPHEAIPDEVFPELTSREREILCMIARGETNADIAGALSIALKTVRSHVSNIYSKLQVANRAQAVIRVREARLDQENGEPAQGQS